MDNVILYSPFLQNLAAEKTYSNLDISLKQANEHRNEWFEGVHSCKQTDTLFAVMEKIVKAEVCKFFKIKVSIFLNQNMG